MVLAARCPFAALAARPAFAQFRIRHYDVLEDLSRITESPRPGAAVRGDRPTPAGDAGERREAVAQGVARQLAGTSAGGATGATVTGFRACADDRARGRAPPGFVGFPLVPGEASSFNTAIVVWESKAQADAFLPELDAWRRVLDEHGHALQSDNRGEAAIALPSRP